MHRQHKTNRPGGFPGKIKDNMKPKNIKTLSQFVDFLNNCEDYPVFEANEIIERNGWEDLQGQDYDVCRSEEGMVTMTEPGNFIVVFF